jgi:glycosyltransferase involved in cell wall biosynthesis
VEILFVHNRPTPFVVIDRDLLGERWRVREWYERTSYVNIPHLTAAVRHCDIVFGWFASWHTFWPFTLARLLHKPALLVVGGYDVANMPEIGYGHQRGGIKKWVSCRVIGSSTRVMTNSDYSQAEIQRNLGLQPERVRVIHHGVPDTFGSLPGDPRERMALTVGDVDATNLLRKGHEAFMQAGCILPDVSFVLAGKWRDGTGERLSAEVAHNVRLTGWTPVDTLYDYYRRASVYVQASYHEGFGMSLAEAMLAGSIPVVTRVGAIPEVVGDTGLYVESQDPAQIAAAVTEGLEMGSEARRLARERILDCFPVERRQQALQALVMETMEAGRRG